MDWSTHLVIIGLLLDIVGAAVIAAPDIPRVNKQFYFGRLKRGKRRLEERLPLMIKETGHDEILNCIEDFHRAIKDDPEWEVQEKKRNLPYLFRTIKSLFHQITRVFKSGNTNILPF